MRNIKTYYADLLSYCFPQFGLAVYPVFANTEKPKIAISFILVLMCLFFVGRLMGKRLDKQAPKNNC